MSIHIRPAVQSDIDRLVALEAAAFAGDRLSRRSLRRFCTTSSARLAVADCGGQVAGYALVLYRRGSNSARLYSIAVRPAMAGKGIGRALLADAEESVRRHGCRSVRLEVREDNGRAAALYLAAGYEQKGHRPAYYEDGAAALLFEKSLLTGSQPKSGVGKAAEGAR